MLAGNKPTWREREAQKVADAAAGGASQPATTAEPAPASTQEDAPKRNGYVPPARRAEGSRAPGSGLAPRGRTDDAVLGNRDLSTGGEASDKWRSSSIRRDDSARNESPSDAGKSAPRSFQRSAVPDRSDTPPAPRTDSPAVSEAPASTGKYVPRFKRNA